MKTNYKNRLPHIAPIGASFFVTFRLADALPQHLVRQLEQELDAKEQLLRREFPNDWFRYFRVEKKRMFTKYEHQLDRLRYGACHLKDPIAANLVINKLKRFDGQYYDLWAYCIMPNHVHVLLDFSRQIMECQNFFLLEIPKNYKQLDYVMMRIKGASSFEINRALNRKGTLWAKDSFDHYVRNEAEWFRIVNYILNNPVKAGLVSAWDEHAFSFCHPSLL
jgi:putative transposase